MNCTYFFSLVQFADTATDTQGFIARDDTRKEIVVVLRGRFVRTPKLPGFVVPDVASAHLSLIFSPTLNSSS